MKLRTVTVGLVGLLFAACVDTDGSCEDTETCANGGSSGAAGAAGSAGAGGTAGNGGSSGAAGMGGSAGTGASGGVSGSSGAAGSSGTAGTGGSDASVCNPADSPEEDDCVIDEQYGVFVSPTGDDTTGDGTQAAPFASVGKGFEAAKSAGKRVYACADGGDYAEALSLTAANSGVAAYGGFRCNDWSYDSSLKAKVAPTSVGYALEADAVNQATRLEHFQFESLDAAAPGQSSIAGFVRDSSALTLVSVGFTAGTGMAGAAGVRAHWNLPTVNDLRGNTATSNSGAGEKVFVCPSGITTIGGLGGTGATTSPTGGGSGSPALGAGAAGVGGNPPPLCAGPGSGGDGANGDPGNAGPGAAQSGSLSATGWQPAPGSPGTAGQDAQGGGGGRGGAPSGGGGSGGAGGCGGDFGAGGQGGGSSIGLLVFNSLVALEQVVIVAQAGGAGGTGQPGQAGVAPGGPGGGEHDLGFGCGGGRGGSGGNGGPGGGGAGGLSVGVLHFGAAPGISGGSITTGTAGAAGPGGPGGNPGVVGRAEGVIEVTN